MDNLLRMDKSHFARSVDMKKETGPDLSMRECGDTVDAVLDIHRHGVQCRREERRHNTLPILVVM